MRITVYNIGVCYASVCAPKDMLPQAVADEVNAQHPTDIQTPWRVSEDPHFAGGQPNPCVCEADPERLHYLLNC